MARDTALPPARLGSLLHRGDDDDDNNNDHGGGDESLESHRLQQQHSVLGSARASFAHVVAEIRRHRRAFCMGTLTVFLVVFFVALLQTAVQSSPIMFFKLAEDTAGCNDLLLAPAPAAGSGALPLLNHTRVNASEAAVGDVQGTTPRWALLVQAIGLVENAVVNASAPTAAPVAPSTTTILLAADDAQERHLRMGRALVPKTPPLVGAQCLVSRTVARQLRYALPLETGAVGRTLTLQLDIVALLQTIGVLSAQPTEAELARLLIAGGLPAAAGMAGVFYFFLSLLMGRTQSIIRISCRAFDTFIPLSLVS